MKCISIGLQHWPGDSWCQVQPDFGGELRFVWSELDFEFLKFWCNVVLRFFQRWEVLSGQSLKPRFQLPKAGFSVSRMSPPASPTQGWLISSMSWAKARWEFKHCFYLTVNYIESGGDDNQGRLNDARHLPHQWGGYSGQAEECRIAQWSRRGGIGYFPPIFCVSIFCLISVV